MALWHATKSGFYMTIGDDQLSGWTDKKLQSTFQSQTCTHKKCYCHCLMVCCPSDPLWLSESWWNHYIWDVCSANRWNASKTAMPAASIGQQKGPSSSPRQWLTTRCTTNTPKVEQLGYNILPHLPYSPDLLPTDYTYSRILTTFYRENTSTTGSKQKMLSKSLLNPEAQTFMLQEKNTYFLLAKMFWS